MKLQISVWWSYKLRQKPLFEIKGKTKSDVCEEKRTVRDMAWSHGDRRYSQLHINFQTRSQWKKVIRPQNGNKSHLEFCHGDPWAWWLTQSMDQGQERRWVVWRKYMGAKCEGKCIYFCEDVCLGVRDGNFTHTQRKHLNATIKLRECERSLCTLFVNW